MLIVDIDPQGNTTTGVGIDKRAVERDVYNVLLQHASIADVARATEVENLSIVPATLNLAGAEIELVSALQRENRLKTALAAVLARLRRRPDRLPAVARPADDQRADRRERSDHPGAGRVLRARRARASSSRSSRRIKEGLNPELTIRGVLITMFDGRTKLATEVLDEVHRYFPDRVFDTQIPRNIRLSEAPSYGKPAILFDVRAAARKPISRSRESCNGSSATA